VAVLMWVRDQWSPARMLAALGAACRHPLPLILLAVDVACLAAGRGSDGWRLTLVPWWTGAKAVAAGVLLLWLACAHRSGRSTCALGGIAAVALGLAVWAPWPARLVALAPDRLPTVLAWLAFYGTIYALTTTVVLAVGSRLQARSPRAGTWFEVAAATGFVVCLACLGNFFLHPNLAEPWATVVWAGLTLVATAALAGSLAVHVNPD
jgi:hypothetical protein